MHLNGIRMRRRLIQFVIIVPFLSFSVWCLSVNRSAAQTEDAAAKIEHPGGRRTTIPKFRLKDGGQARHFGLVLAEDAELYRGPSCDQEVVNRVRLLSTYFVVDLHVDKDKATFYLLGKPRQNGADDQDLEVAEEFGWIPGIHLRLYPEETSPRLYALKDARTSVYRKCMLVRNPTATVPSGDTARVGFYDRPDSLGKMIEDRPLFDIYYIYAEKRDAPNQPPTHFFVGQQPYDDVARSLPSLLGWVRTDRVEEWNTREALEFNKRDWEHRDEEAPALVFKTRTALLAYLNAPAPRPSMEMLDKAGVLIGTEDMSRSDRMAPDMPRYPILSGEAEPLDNDTHIYRVGVIGDVYGEGDTVTGQELAALRQEANRLIDEARYLQILFVIDNTGSMEHMRPELQDLIQRLQRRITQIRVSHVDPTAEDASTRSYRISDVEYSLNFYRADGDPASLQPHRFGSDRACSDILERVKFLGGGGTTRLFSAIKEALDTAQFQPDRTKIVVIVGDNGNKTDDTIGAEQVASHIIQEGGENPITFISFCVGDGEHRQLFEQQTDEIGHRIVEDIQRRANERSLRMGQGDLTASMKALIESQYMKNVRTRDAQVVADTIEEIFQAKLIEINQKVELQRMKILAQESTPPPKSDPAGFIWNLQIIDQYEQSGNAETIQKIQGGVQRFTDGWVVDRHPEQKPFPERQEVPMAFRPMVLMHRAELDQLERFVSNIVVTRTYDDEELWQEAFKTLVKGEKLNPGDNMGEILLKYNAIQCQTGILAMPFNSLMEMPRRQRMEIYHDLDRILLQLSGALRYGELRMYEHGPPVGMMLGQWKMVGVEGEDPDKERTGADKPSIWFKTDPNALDPYDKAWIPREFLP